MSTKRLFWTWGRKILRVHKAKRTLPVGDRLKAHGYVVNERGCWIWQGDKTYRGYGRMSVKNRSRSVHRLAYEAWVAPIPEGMLIRHKCDTPLCINPEHLTPGTHKDNMRDKYERGRDNTPRGENHYETKRRKLKCQL